VAGAVVGAALGTDVYNAGLYLVAQHGDPRDGRLSIGSEGAAQISLDDQAAINVTLELDEAAATSAAAFGMDNTSTRACLASQERRRPRPRSGLQTAAAGPTSPQTARSTTTTSNFGGAVNSSIVPVISTGRLAQVRRGTRTWSHACAKKQRQNKNKSNMRPSKAPAMCTNAPASAHHASHDAPT